MPWEVGTVNDPCGSGNISPYNYNPNGKFYLILNNSTLIQASGVKLLRYGGTTADLNGLTWGSPTSQWDEFILAAQSMGAEPVIQIPFLKQFKCDGMVSTTTSANNAITNYVTSLVTYIMTNYPSVKYYSIGNEPDRYDNSFGSFPLSATDVRNYFRPISEKIKTIYASASNPVPFVIGPDLAESWAGYGPPPFTMTDFIGGAGDITAQITSITSGTYYYCDIYAYHTYPFDGTQGRTAVINHPSGNYFSDLTLIRNRIASSFNNNPNLKIALTEFNVNWQNNTTNTPANQSANSFLAGQWMADMFATGLRPPAVVTENAQVAFMVPWNVHEKSGSTLPEDLGLLNGQYVSSTNLPTGRSTYYHLQMMANFCDVGPLGQTYYWPATITNNSANEIKAFSIQQTSRGSNVAVMILYQSQLATKKSFSIRFNGASTGKDHEININGSPFTSTSTTYTFDGFLKPERSIFIVFNCAGELKYKQEYSMEDAMNDLPPWLIFYNPSPCRDALPPKCPVAQINHLNVSGNVTLSDSTRVTGTIKVLNNAELKIDGAYLSFSPNSKIQVMPGGRLTVSNRAQLTSCSGDIWKGIDVKGNYNPATHVSITNSIISNAETALRADKVQGIVVTQNIFDRGTTAINITRSTGLDIYDNEFYRYLHTVPESQTLSGTLFGSQACGGGTSAGDTLLLLDSTFQSVQGVTPVVTDANGNFVFNYFELNQLDQNTQFTFDTKNSAPLEFPGFNSIPGWVALSPITLAKSDGNTWAQKTDFGGTARYGGAGFSIAGKGYIGLGFDGSSYRDDFWEYDPTTDSWTQKASYPPGGRHSSSGYSISMAINNRGYVGTGLNQFGVWNDFWEFDPVANTWTQKANFPPGLRYAATGFSIGNKGYLGLGTETGSGPFHNDIWEYDQGTDTWTQKANFGGAVRSGAVGFSIGGKGYIGAGSNVAIGQYYNDFWEFDPVADAWTQKASLPAAGRLGAVGFAMNGKGYIATGANFILNQFYNDVWEYDPANDTWTQVTDFAGTARWGAIAFAIGNKGYIGTGNSGPYKKDLWEYSPSQCGSSSRFMSNTGENTDPEGMPLPSAISIYPNPNTGSMTVKYSVPENQTGEFAIYNLIGVKVAGYALPTGKTNTLSVSESSLTEGIYLYRVSSNNKMIEQGKIIVIK